MGGSQEAPGPRFSPKGDPWEGQPRPPGFQQRAHGSPRQGLCLRSESDAEAYLAKFYTHHLTFTTCLGSGFNSPTPETRK